MDHSLTSKNQSIGDEATHKERQPKKKRKAFKSNRGILFFAGLFIVVLALISAIATYFILTGLTPIIPNHDVVVTVLFINVLMILALITIVLWQLILLWRERRQQAAGAELHIRIVGLFSLIALLPAVILAIFASVSLDRGLDHWFGDRTKKIIQNSVNVAEAYLHEHGQVIRNDIVAMAIDLDEASLNLSLTSKEYEQLLTSQMALRALNMVYVLNQEGKVVAKATTAEKPRDLNIDPDYLAEAKEGKTLVLPTNRGREIAALKRLDRDQNHYLYVLRFVNPEVTGHLRRTQQNSAEYRALEERRSGVQVAFALMYVTIALTLLLAAVWLGLWLANKIISPIRNLINAAASVSEGNLDTQVKVKRRDGDIGQLSSTFNFMTNQIRRQHNYLKATNETLDERRRLIEAVLSGVSAGVIGIDGEGEVDLVNHSAETLLDVQAGDLIGRHLEHSIAEFAPIILRAKTEGANACKEEHVNLIVKGIERNFAVQITEEGSDKRNYGFVVTFDDITELVTAQRNGAWADIARRIAHEIKNPLTPIQLSAERLRRKYNDVIVQDREIFEKCTDTIIRQVGDIGQMVDEFSSFARLPKPQMENTDIRDVVREAVFLFQVSEPSIKFNVSVPDEKIIAWIDRRLINQAVTNLVKNASEAIQARKDGKSEAEISNGVGSQVSEQGNGSEAELNNQFSNSTDVTKFQGRIDVSVKCDDNNIHIEVIDNGCGLPKKNRNRLKEPYMTTREKGTGLGLAIVQRITEQHQGHLLLEDAPQCKEGENGAKISIVLQAGTVEILSEQIQPNLDELNQQT